MSRKNAPLSADSRLRSRHRLLTLAATFLCFELSGCGHASELNLFGAYFPVWLLALVVGVAAAFAARYLLARLQIEAYLGSLTLIYVCITVSISCLVWLLFA